MIQIQISIIVNSFNQEVSKIMADNNYIGVTTGCGASYVSTFYFVSFYLVVPLIFLNLFIAIILEGFTSTNNAMSSLLQDDDLD
jgi:hypothetical protein